MKKYTLHNSINLKKLAACLLLWAAVLSLVPCQADSESTDLFSARYDEPIILPYKDEIPFSHNGNSATLQTRTLSFHSPTRSIVTICFTKAKTANGDISNVTVSVYTDTAELICTKNAGDEVTLLQFIPVYTGSYHIVVESRSAAAGDYLASIEISASTGYSLNTVDSYPHSKSYTKKNHKSNKVRDLYPSTMYPNTEYMLSVFALEHAASSIITYKLNTPDSSEIRAVLYTDAGDRYLPHQSHSSSGYAAGDAQELYNKKTAYLFVYSRGEFTLELEQLSSGEAKISEIPCNYKGLLDVSDTPLLYDEEKINAIIREFPFSEIKNRNAQFFKLSGSGASVYSFLCERKEHAYFTLVSDVYGLSYNSLYPLRSYNEYCSEIEPTELCYGSAISDGAAVYLAYTGTGDSVYVELYSSPTHTIHTELEKKYSQDQPLPQIIIKNIYDDREIFDILKVKQNAPDVSRINGYMLESEAMYRHYYEGTGVITPPAQKGKYKLYAIINSSIMSEDGSIEQRYYSYFISDITIEGRFSIPSVEDIISAVENEDPAALIMIIILSILLLTGIAVSVRALILKYSLSKTDSHPPMTVTDHAIINDDEKEAERVGQPIQTSDKKE